LGISLSIVSAVAGVCIEVRSGPISLPLELTKSSNQKRERSDKKWAWQKGKIVAVLW